MADLRRHDRLITIFGGPGFVGRYAVREFASRGWRIRAASRRPDLAGHLQPMGAVGQIHAVQANLRFPDSVARAIEGADAVVNAVGILARSGKQTFKSVHEDGPRAIARAAREAGVNKFVHVSAIGADAKSRSDYGKSKAKGEEAVLEEFPSAVILRPSIVFGPEDEFFNRFANMARFSPLLPLIGGGRTKFQPIYVGDLATAIVNATENGGNAGSIYELGGPEILSFRQLLDRTKTWSGRHPGYLYLPFWIAKLQALLTWPLPNSVRPITYDQVRLLQKDNVVSASAKEENRTLGALAITHPQSVGAIVPTYLERYRKRGQFASYR